MIVPFAFKREDTIIYIKVIFSISRVAADSPSGRLARLAPGGDKGRACLQEAGELSRIRI